MHNPASALMASGRQMAPLAPSLTTAQTTSAHGSGGAGASRRGAAGIRTYVDGTTTTTNLPLTSSSSSSSSAVFAATPAEINVLPRSSSVMLATPSSSVRPYAAASSATPVGPRPSSAAEGSFNVHPCFRRDAQWRGDILVKVQGVHFWCHKAILYFASPFFQAVIDGDWVESHPSLHRVPSISSATSRLSATDGHGDERGGKEEDTPRLDEEVVEETAGNGSDGGFPAAKHAKAESEHDHDVEDTREAEGDACQASSSQRLGSDKARQRDSFHTAIIDLDEGPATAAANGMRWSQSSASTPPPIGASDVPAGAAPSASTVGPSPADSQARRQRSASEGGSAEQLFKSKQSASLTAQSADRGGKRGASGLHTAVSAPGTPSLVQPCNRDLSLRLESLATPPGSPAIRMASLPSSTPESVGVVRKSAGEKEEPRPEPRNKHLQHQHQHRRPRRRDGAQSSARESTEGIVAIIELPEEEAAIFQDVLFHIYPQLDLLVNWTNIAGLLRFDEQYEIHGLRRSCTTFLRAALAGRPVQAMSLAEAHARGAADLPGSGLGLEDIFKEASRHVLDMWSSLEGDELGALSSETLLKLERKRTWFLERLLKLGLANPERDYECHASCPDPSLCARNLSDRFRSAFSGCFRYGPPQPSVIWRLRELEGVPNLPSMSLSCDAAARAWTQTLFDRMFSLPLTSRAQSKFLYIKLHETNALHPYRNTTTQAAGSGGVGAGLVSATAAGGGGVGSQGIVGASTLLPRLNRG